MKLRVDKQFQALCPPLGAEERNLLELNILRDGCLEPIAVWSADGKTILDGHNRYEICSDNGVAFQTKVIDVVDRSDAINWIIGKQLGRRNLTDEQRSYLRGKRYQAENAGKARPQDADRGAQNGHHGKTSERLAKEYGVGKTTIQRDHEFARAVDKLDAPDREAVLSGRSGLSLKDVRNGRKPGEKPLTIRSAKRALRARERADGGAARVAAIAGEDVAAIAGAKQKRLAELCESIKQLAALAADILKSEEKYRIAAKSERWTPHSKQRVRADLSAIKKDLSRLDQLLK